MTNTVKNRIIIVYMGATLVLLTSCSKIGDFGNINENPNQSLSIQTSSLLSAAIDGAPTSSSTNSLYSGGYWRASIAGTIGTNRPRVGFYCQYFSQTQYTDESLYSLYNANWSQFYAECLKDLQTIITINTESPEIAKEFGKAVNQISVARILKAYYFSVVTDLYGDIPYKEALNQNNKQPSYAKQQEIYNDLFKELKEASANIDPTDKTLKGDILFLGDLLKWRKFANSLRCILALRISKADFNKGKAEFIDALSSGVIVDSAESANLSYPGGNFKSPWYNFGSDYSVSKTLTDVINSYSNGPILFKGYGPTNSGQLWGFPYGLKRESALKIVIPPSITPSILVGDFRSEMGQAMGLSVSDVYLARAEAAHLGWTTENAKDMYDRGITLAAQYWNKTITLAEINDYLSNPDVTLNNDKSESDRRKIAIHRWIIFYPNAVQGFAEWRRSGIPELSPSLDATNSSKKIPRRIQYPNIEYTNNNANLLNGIQGLSSKTDDDQARVWWDKE